MSIFGKGLTALALVGTVAISSVAPTQAQSMTFSYGQRDRVITTYCDRNPRDRDCRSYRNGGWRDSDYDRFYGSRRRQRRDWPFWLGLWCHSGRRYCELEQ